MEAGRVWSSNWSSVATPSVFNVAWVSSGRGPIWRCAKESKDIGSKMRLNDGKIQCLNIQKNPTITLQKPRPAPSLQYSYLIYCCLSNRSRKPMNKADHSLQIRISDSFCTNGGVGTVPRIHFYLIGEHHQLLLNAGNQLLMVAAGQVGAPHTALK